MNDFTQLAPLAGSEKSAPEVAALNTLAPNEVLTVTIRIRRKQPLTPLFTTESAVPQVVSRSEYASQYGAEPDVVKQIEDFATAYSLDVIEKDLGRRSVILRGTVAQMQRAFGVSLNNYRADDGTEFRGRSGFIQVPTELVDSIEGVFGLDNRPQAKAHFQVYKPGGDAQIVALAVSNSFTPPQLARLYNYPANVTGKGQCIAIIELGGGFRKADITAYFTSLGLKAPSVVAVSVDGGRNAPGTADGADGEVMLDIEVAGGVAPGAKIVVYFAPNTDQGFLDAITTALHDTKYKPSVISISWGAAEKDWTPQALTSFNQAFQSAAALGVTICAAAGDAGSDDSVGDGSAHVDFPSSSPFVLACGGTRLTASDNAVTEEVVWHESNTSATGGGISDVFDLPTYQQTSHIPKSVNDNKHVGRGVPDVAAVADPATGYAVRVDGKNLVIGGTSAVAPLMAGLIALINQEKGKPVGFIHPAIYANPGVFRDIDQGNNSTTKTNKGYTAKAGWDACTGLGVADGQKLATVLSSQTAPA